MKYIAMLGHRNKRRARNINDNDVDASDEDTLNNNNIGLAESQTRAQKNILKTTNGFPDNKLVLHEGTEQIALTKQKHLCQ